jgi:hypothetical protein
LGVNVRTVGRMLFSIADPGSQFVIEFVPVTIDGEPRCLEHSRRQDSCRTDTFLTSRLASTSALAQAGGVAGRS